MLIHRSNRFGLCPQHYQQHQSRIKEERRSTKARKARALQAQLAAQIHALEEEHMVDIHKIEEPVRAVRNGNLTDEQKQEIGLRYERGETYAQIQEMTGINNGAISDTVTELGLPRRGKGPQPKIEALPRRTAGEEIPEPQRVALEHMLTEPDRSQMPPKLSPKPEPVAPTPSVERRAPRMHMQRWAISVEGTLLIEAPDIVEALRLAQQHDLRITAINPA